MSDDLTVWDLLAFVGEGVQEPIRMLTSGLTDLSRSPEVVLLRQTLKSAQVVGAASSRLTPEVVEALGQVRRLGDRLRREGLDPALGLANLIGDCLDGLEVLVATDTVPLPAELEELRLVLARLRRTEVRLDLALPAERGRAALGGRLVRTLVEGAGDLAESLADLADLESAVAEAIAGAVERTRAYDPARTVEVHARLRGDLLTLDVVDWGTGDAYPERASGAGWDLSVVRSVMDQVSYEPREQGSVLHLRKRLRSWRWRGA